MINTVGSTVLGSVMRFKWTLCFLLFTQCEVKRVQPHKVTQESQGYQLKKETVDESLSINNHENHAHKIEDAHETELLDYYSDLKKKLHLSGNEYSRINYASKAYIRNLTLLASIYQRAQSIGFQSLIKTINSFFYSYYLKDCLDPNNQNCELLKYSVSKEAQLVDIFLSLAKNELDELKSLKILEASFEIASHQKNIALNQAYTQRIIQVLEKKSELEIDKNRTQILLTNLDFLVKNINWTEFNPINFNLFSSLKPWNYDVKNSTNELFSEAQLHLLNYLPLYSYKYSEIENKLNKSVSTHIEALKFEGYELTKYPAYNDIDLDPLKAKSSASTFLALKLITADVAPHQVYNFFINVKDQSLFIDELFESLKLLARFEFAQLSLKTNKRLMNQFSKKEVKTNEFFQSTLKWAESLNPEWTDLYGRVGKAFDYLNARINHSSNSNSEDISYFTDSAKRSILKSVAYPNMYAYAHKLSETDWTAEFKVFWYTFTLTTSDIWDYMLTGQYVYPWFNLTNMQETRSTKLEDKSGLFRSEMYDSLHYFFSTRIYETYEINVDDFLTTIGDSLLKKRIGDYQDAIDQFQSNHLPSNSLTQQYKNWCDGIRNNNPIDEQIPYTKLSSFLTPLGLKYDNLRVNTKDISSLLYNDSILKPVDVGNATLATINDRYRLELEPILHTLKQYKKIAQRAGLNLNTEFKLTRFTKLIKDTELLMMRFLGLQVHISNQLSDCFFVAHDESRRRAKEVVKAQYSYYKNLVHPLMTAIKDSKISLSEANQKIQEAHGEFTVEDQFNLDEYGNLTYFLTKQAFFLRTKIYLESGFNFKLFNQTALDIKAVVGQHLDISLPPEYQTNSKLNPYLLETEAAKSPKNMSVNYEADPKGFAKSLTQLTTDRSRSARLINHQFTSWDLSESEPFTHVHLMYIEYFVSMLQLQKPNYIDYSDASCIESKDLSLIDESCIKTGISSLKELNKSIGRVLSSFLLTPDDIQYFEITGQNSWLASNQLNTVLKYDSSIPFFFNGNYLPFSKLSGVFDLSYQMLSKDYLGILFSTDWELEQERINSEGQGLTITCTATRLGCYWNNERDSAYEFLLSRFKKAGVIFNYDTEILSDDYSYVKSRALKKYQNLMNIEEQGPQLVDETIETHELPHPEVRISLWKDAQELEVLSPRFKNSAREFDKFFKEKTESLFLIEPDWSNFIVK